MINGNVIICEWEGFNGILEEVFNGVIKVGFKNCKKIV